MVVCRVACSCGEGVLRGGWGDWVLVWVVWCRGCFRVGSVVGVVWAG